jgi:AcrR family transcriptional regulator
MKKEKMESILATARHMFVKYGIQKTTLEDIARFSRVAKATIYNYFGSKDRVYLEVLNREADAMTARILEEVARMTSPLDKLRVFVFSSFSLLRTSADIFNLRSEFLGHLVAGTENIRKKLFTMQLSILQPILKEGVVTGFFRNDSIHAARSILYAVRGMELTWLLDPESTEVDEDIETFFDLLCRGILAKEDAPCV